MADAADDVTSEPPGPSGISTDPNGRPTVATVAEVAGVSVASVSRVLNGQPASDDMTRRVREAVASLGYVPDAAARSLKAKRAQQLAFAVHDVGNPTYVGLMRAIESRTREAGYRLLVSSTGAEYDVELSLLRSLGQRYVDGLIMSPIRITDEHLELLAQAPVPVVVIGTVPEAVGIDTVMANSRHGVGLAVEHLVASGRERIGFVNGLVDTVPGAARRAGFESGMAAAGARVDEAFLEESDFSYTSGYDAACRLLDRVRPDALMCANDVIAVAVLRAASEHGLEVPRDLAVVGVDDSELARMALPSLSSVSLGTDERGRIAAELLLDRISDPSLPPRRLTVGPHLVVRQSSAVQERRAPE